MRKAYPVLINLLILCCITTAQEIESLHDFYRLETTLSGTAMWSPDCSLDDGKIYGGTQKEDAFGAAKACGGYVMVGRSTSKNDNHVECNHDLTSPYAYDAWILKVDESGNVQWDESLGDTLDDEAHIIRRMPDGSYVLVGETNTGGFPDFKNFYVARFQLLECSAVSASSLQATALNCSTVIFNWGAVACAVSYELAYKIDGGSWVPVTGTSSPDTISGLSPGAKYSWRVRSLCSPNVKSSWANGTDVTLPACKLGRDATLHNLVVYPNPAQEQITLSLKIPAAVYGTGRIVVYDPTGRIIHSLPADIQNGLLQEELLVRRLPSGFYRISVEVNGEAFRTKLIFQ